MEKRFIAAFVLSILILIGWSLISKRLFPPPPVPVQTETPATPEPPAGEAGTTPEAPVAAPPTPASAAAVAAVAEREVRLETELADIILTNKGGRVRSWQLKKFQSAGNAVDFVSAAGRREDALPLSLAFDDRTTLPGINGELFEVTREDGPSGSIRVRFHWSDGAGSEVEKILVFSAREPLVDVSVKATDRGRAVTPRICLGPGLEVEDSKHRSNTYYNGQAVVYDGNQVTRMSRRKIDAPLILPEIPGLQWAGLEDQYFTALVVPGGARGAVTIAPWPQSALARAGKTPPEDIATAPVVSVSIPDGRTQLFVGPKNFGLLSSLGHDLEKAVWFSSYKPIYVFAKPIFLALRFVHDHWVANYGVAIVLLTFGLRILLFPLNQFSMVKMRKTAGEMQRIQPKLKALQAKYKKNKDADSRAKLNAETMDLYKREGVNPFGGVSGCLPLLIQMPILWAFYDVLTATVELRGAPFFGWIRDLTHPDAFWITPILMGATMFVQQRMTPTANVDPQQQRMMMFMPLIFTVMFVALPSGLVLYYFVNNLLGIGQQWLVNRHIARLEAAPSKA